MARDANAMALSQSDLNAANTEVKLLADQYFGGLISIVEFVDAISYQKSKVGSINLSGLTDPNTGLSYPTEEETAAFMRKFDSIAAPSND